MNSGEKILDSKKCEACSAQFSCGARSGAACWCFEIEAAPSAETLRLLSEKYKNCLCRDCLIRETALLLPQHSSAAENSF